MVYLKPGPATREGRGRNRRASLPWSSTVTARAFRPIISSPSRGRRAAERLDERRVLGRPGHAYVTVGPFRYGYGYDPSTRDRAAAGPGARTATAAARKLLA